jgi:hypothetical protein
MTILPSDSVNLCHCAGPNNSLVTITITRDGMKVSSVTLNPDRTARGPVCEQEIQPEGSCVGIDLVLPPESHLIIRKLVKLVEHEVLDGTVALLPGEGFTGPIKPVLEKFGGVHHSIGGEGTHIGSANASDQATASGRRC